MKLVKAVSPTLPKLIKTESLKDENENEYSPDVSFSTRKRTCKEQNLVSKQKVWSESTCPSCRRLICIHTAAYSVA